MWWKHNICSLYLKCLITRHQQMFLHLFFISWLYRFVRMCFILPFSRSCQVWLPLEVASFWGNWSYLKSFIGFPCSHRLPKGLPLGCPQHRAGCWPQTGFSGCWVATVTTCLGPVGWLTEAALKATPFSHIFLVPHKWIFLVVIKVFNSFSHIYGLTSL